MWFKWIFDRLMALLGLLVLWPVLLVVAILVRIKMPGDRLSLSRSAWVKMANYLPATSSAL